MSKKVIIKGKKVIGGVAEGEALVSKIPTLGQAVDFRLGVITETDHPLEGIPLKGKVFVFPMPRGSGAWAVNFGKTTQYGVNPTAMVYWKGNALTIRGAVALGRPTVGECEQDPSKIIDTGDWVKVDGDRGIVEVTKKE